MNQPEQSRQPFFVRFLESQNKQEQQTGTREQNEPWPFPQPTSPFKDGPYTDKYPSDGDDF